MAPDYLVEVRDPSFVKKGQIAPEYLDLKFVEVFRSVGSWELKLPTGHPLLDQLKTKGSGIVVTERATGRVFSGRVTSCVLSQDANDPDGTWLISGNDDNVVAAASLCFPDPASAPDVQTTAYYTASGTGELVMKNLVKANIAESATTARKYSWLTTAAGSALGTTVSVSLRFDNMGDALTSIGIKSGIGWRFSQVGTGVVFSVFQPADKTALVRLDVRNGGLESSELGWSAPAATQVLVLGQGEGVDRTVKPVSSAASLAEAAAWGLRWEVSKDQRNTDDPTELTQAGNEILADKGSTINSLKVTPSDAPGQKLGTDWWLGDLVTVVIDGTPTTATVTQVATSITAEGFIRQATVGDPVGFDWEAKVGHAITQHESRITDLETQVEAGVTWGSIANVPTTFPTREPLDANGQLITDANSAIDNGWYYGNAMANAPAEVSTTTVGSIHVFHGAAANNIKQEFRRIATDSSIADDRVWTRVSTNAGSTWSAWRRKGNAPWRGTAAQRAATTSVYWEFWQDTDSTGLLYVGDSSGGWRQFSGQTGWTAAAWDTTGTSGAAIMAGRTITLTIPTVLETNEHLLFQLVAGGSGFTFISGSSITRNVSNTTLVIRYMQLLSTVTQAGTIQWQVAQF